jgi:hypothetical protein
VEILEADQRRVSLIPATRIHESRFADEFNGHHLSHVVAGQIPYFYREPAKIAADFAARHDALPDQLVFESTRQICRNLSAVRNRIAPPSKLPCR